jgi:hypothetical protein
MEKNGQQRKADERKVKLRDLVRDLTQHESWLFLFLTSLRQENKFFHDQLLPKDQIILRQVSFLHKVETRRA